MPLTSHQAFRHRPSRRLESDHRREAAFFPPRLGFVKAAMRHGVPLLPAYIFGENQVSPPFTTLIHSPHSHRSCKPLIHATLRATVHTAHSHTPRTHHTPPQAYRTSPRGRAFSKRIHALSGVPIVPVHGAMGLPWLVPLRGEYVHIRWGEPVPVGPPNASPSDAEVHAVFDAYVCELRRLFDAHKDECLPPAVAARGLTVVERGRHGGCPGPVTVAQGCATSRSKL